jgi:hypothetical protein
VEEGRVLSGVRMHIHMSVGWVRNSFTKNSTYIPRTWCHCSFIVKMISLHISLHNYITHCLVSQIPLLWRECGRLMLWSGTALHQNKELNLKVQGSRSWTVTYQLNIKFLNGMVSYIFHNHLTCFGEEIRVARWFLFKQKILIWVNFGGTLMGK